MVTTIRTQVRLQGFTQLPEDIYTNTLYFRIPEVDVPLELTTIESRLQAAYGTPGWGGRYSTVVRTPVEWRMYDMADVEPRVPVREGTFDLPSHDNSGLVEEVAVCLSYRAENESGQPAGRRRGRIYIGPLGTTNISNGTSSSYSSIATACTTAVINGAEELHALDQNGVQWVVHSPTDGASRLIVEAWVDNAPDIQRRRGRQPSARTSVQF